MRASTKVLIGVAAVIIIGVIGYLAHACLVTREGEEDTGDLPAVTSFEECLEAGNPVMESYPRQCTTPEGEVFTEEIADESEDSAGIANPASEYCEEQGGTVDIRDEDAGQVGYCVFENGSECEEWAYYRGECEPSL